MLRRDLADGDLARIATRRGTIIVPVAASEELKPGQIFLPMHWGSAALGGDGMHGVNALTSPVCCPQSAQPELKHAASRVTKADLPWRIAAFGYPPAGDAMELRAALRALMVAAPFASVVLIGRERAGVLFRAAFAAPPDAAWLAAVDVAFGLAGETVARYEDARRGVGRAIRIAAGRIEAVRLAGDTIAEGWLRAYLLGERDVTTLRHQLLKPGAEAPAGYAARGRIVCACFDVAEADVRAALAEAPCADALARVQSKLRCGTNCGSCLPELRRLTQIAA
jgi:assimilatory nitrate reductase catalytic subunit